MSITTIGTVAVERETTSLVYDAQTGDIVYVHHFVTLQGGVPPDDKAAESKALAELERIRPEFKAKRAVLHVPSSAIKPDTDYRVDAARQALVERSAPRSSSRTRTEQ
jgi:hypothetical protein